MASILSPPPASSTVPPTTLPGPPPALPGPPPALPGPPPAIIHSDSTTTVPSTPEVLAPLTQEDAPLSKGETKHPTTTAATTTTSATNILNANNALLIQLKKLINNDINAHNDKVLYPNYKRRWNFDTAPLDDFNKTKDDLLLQYLNWSTSKVKTKDSRNAATQSQKSELNNKIVQLAFQRLLKYVTFSERNRNVLMKPKLTLSSIRLCYSRLGICSMKQLDRLNRRVLTVDISSSKRYDSLNKQPSNTTNVRQTDLSNNRSSSSTSLKRLRDEDYLRLFYYICHSCLFDNSSIMNGIIIIINLNFIGPFEYRMSIFVSFSPSLYYMKTFTKIF